jgi:heptaprenyl diphosphate synthase
MKLSTNRLTRISLLICVALVLSYAERFFIIPIAVPGVRLGLANLAVIIALYIGNETDAFFVSVLRIFLAAFLLGSVGGLLFSLGGGLLSFAIMCLAKKNRLFSLSGVSILGGIFHNIGQILVFALVVETVGILSYLPILIITGAISGLLNGVAASFIIRVLSN